MAESTNFDFDDIVVYTVDCPRFVTFHGRNALPFILSVNEEDGMVYWMRVGFHRFITLSVKAYYYG